ncbi:MAG: YciI family protein [Aeromicrobium sp.]|uniref:YciI family protein n=1 Tax=Aeromicrobium sp. TaxID=1871063 RepID=UPI003C583E23
MKFMIAMYTVPDDSVALSPEQLSEIELKHSRFRERLEASGTLLNGAGLEFRRESLVLHEGHGRNDGLNCTEGNRAEMTAFYVVECQSTETAAALASELLDDHVVAVDVRGIHHSNGM